jgi:hypothetical protein
VAFVLGFAGLGLAEEKEQTFAGKVTCAKCELNKEKSCTTVLVVKKGDKETIYYFDKDAHKKYHGEICSGGKDGKVTGSISEKDGKHWIKVSKCEFTEK